MEMNPELNGGPIEEQDLTAAPAEELSGNESESAADEVESDGQTDPASVDADEQTDAEETKPRKSGFERRVAKLNARVSEKELEVEFWKQKALGANPPAAAPAPQAAAKPKFEDYNDIEAYTEAVTEWKLEQKLQSYDSERKARTQQETVANNYEARRIEFEKSHPDFQDVMAEADHVNMSQIALAAILESEIGPQLAYELSKNVDEAERISRLSPARQVAEIGKLEERLSSKKAAPVAAKVSKAPAPIKPASGKAAIKTADLNDPNLSFEDFKRIRQEQLKARR